VEDGANQIIDCIYCGPGKVASKEDVIPRAIGGRFSSSDIICRNCNSKFGSFVDHLITDWMPILKARHIFDLEGYSGTIAGYEVVTQDGQNLVVDRYERLRPKRAAPVKHEQGDSFEFITSAPSEEEALRAVDQYIARKTAEKGRPPLILEKNVKRIIHREWSDASSNVVYSLEEQGRAIAKMAFHYLATQLDRRFLQTRDFDAIRRFVQTGQLGKHASLCQHALTGTGPKFEAADIGHVLTLRCCHELRSAICDVTLFGALSWSVVLSWTYEGPDLYRRLTCAPLEKRYIETEIDKIPMPASILMLADEAELDARFKQFHDSVVAFVQWLNLLGFLRYVRAALLRIMTELPNDLLRKQGLDTYLAALANRFSDASHPRILRRFLGEPSKLAAKTIQGEISRLGLASEVSTSEIEEEFSRLIYLRLVVDSLARLVAHDGA
jgi:hypothetical protein